MAEDYFDQEDDGGEMPEKGMGKDGDHEEDGEKKTAVINSEICPGMEPGDVMELRIEEVHDKEYTVSYEPKENKVEHGKDMGKDPNPEGGGGGGEYASMYE